MTKNFLTILAVFLISAIAVEAYAKVSVSEKVKYFGISGKTGKQLYSQIRRKAPLELRRKKWLAATYANYSFKNVKFGVRKNRCVVLSSNIRLKLTYHYPKWTRRKGSSKNVQKQWEKFNRGLIRHEKTHGKFYGDMLRSIDKELRRKKGGARQGCKRFIASMARKIAAIEKRYNNKHNAFDRKENRSSSRTSKIVIAFVRTK